MSEAIAISNDWQMTPLKEVLTKSDEWIDLKPDQKYQQVTVRMWGQGVVKRGEVTGVEVASKRMLVVHPQQFIVSRIDARHGASGLIPDALDGAIVTNDFPVFTPNPSKILPKFLSWMSKTHSFVDLCIAASEGTTNRVRLKEDRFLAMQIPLPSLEVQRRVVTRIEELVAKVEEARELRSTTLQEAESLARSYLDKIYETYVEEFGIVALEQVCLSITDGDHTTPKFTEKGVKFIFVGNVSSGSLHFNGCKYVDSEYFALIKAHRKPSKGDILYSAVGATLGIPAIVDSDEEFCFQRHIALLKLDYNQMNSKFLWHILKSNRLYKAAWAGTTGSAQPTVPLKAIRSLEVPVPSLETQQDAVTHLDDLQSKINTLKQLQSETEAELNALLPSILDKAFKGEL